MVSRSGLPLGSVARSSTSTSRVGRACAPICSETATRASSSWVDSLRRRASPRGTTTTDASPQRSSETADDDRGLEPGNRAHDAFDAIERDVDAARDDDVVDPPANAQDAVFDDPGVAGAIPARAALVAEERRPRWPRCRRGTRPRASAPRPAPRRRRCAPRRHAAAARRRCSRRSSRSTRTCERRARRHPPPAPGWQPRSPDRRRGSSRRTAAPRAPWSPPRQRRAASRAARARARCRSARGCPDRSRAS